MVIANLRLFLDVLFKFSIAVSAQKPLEDGLLHLLVVLLLEEVVMEKLN